MQLRLNKLALGQVSIQLMSSQQLQHNLQMSDVLSPVLAEHHYVIQVRNDKVTNDVLEHTMHKMHVGR